MRHHLHNISIMQKPDSEVDPVLLKFSYANYKNLQSNRTTRLILLLPLGSLLVD